MVIPTYEKDPDAVLDYQHDWTAWLNGDTIVTSNWIVPAGLTLVTDTKTAATTTVWLSGGTIGVTYRVVNRVTTAGGRTDDRSLFLKIMER